MFENFISLGSNCLVARALEKHGFRSVSGPFDWCITCFSRSIIPLLQNNFADFMAFENLEEKDGYNRKEFVDTKYGITYPHEITVSLAQDYPQIYQKYQRRIERFRQIVRAPACFVCGIWSVEELDYIARCEKKIDEAIKFHPDNEIIFVVPRYVYEQNPVMTKYRIFVVEVDINGFFLGREESEAFFDSGRELLDWMAAHYDKEKRKDNLLFWMEKKIEVEKKRNRESAHYAAIEKLKRRVKIEHEKGVMLTIKNRELCCEKKLWVKIAETDFEALTYPVKKISICGCAAIEKFFYRSAKEYVEVLEFIGEAQKETCYDGIPVVSIAEARTEPDMRMVVSAYDYHRTVREWKEVRGFVPEITTIEHFLAGSDGEKSDGKGY